MPYLYETHLHTMQGSACGKVLGHDYIAKYQDLGYAGIMVTDHFFHGNCRPDRSLPWDKWVDEYCRGYQDALEEGEKQGLQVFFGLEERFDLWDEWLVYGLTKPFMLEHPDMREWTRRQWIDQVHAFGGCVVQCHPFRQALYMNHIAPCLGVDGVEVYNSGNRPEWDALALRYARRMMDGRFFSSGSDIHHTSDREGDQVFGVGFESPLRDVHDYVRAVRENAPHSLLHSSDRGSSWTGDPRKGIGLPVTVLGDDGKDAGLDIGDIF